MTAVLILSIRYASMCVTILMGSSVNVSYKIQNISMFTFVLMQTIN